MRGQASSSLLRRELIQVNWGYIRMYVTCTYVMIYQGVIFKGNVEQFMLSIVKG